MLRRGKQSESLTERQLNRVSTNALNGSIAGKRARFVVLMCAAATMVTDSDALSVAGSCDACNEGESARWKIGVRIASSHDARVRLGARYRWHTHTQHRQMRASCFPRLSHGTVNDFRILLTSQSRNSNIV